ncbi:hypothetical protein M422DRAFT_258383 [Sphaerobolus stellatus SS14]|uniref:Unplaced genomic scaffold SPHSTscaffold_81, whole genome shotgun sequence n=1 Tax=Sphaerobolus stellatus (strain SS14) TaxID=990650 RepID=A0A0C9VMS0_SPHS4|nr:hypothetical protein M422DRAFT_258383 [Sphaerobolus stellatus SS14]
MAPTELVSYRGTPVCPGGIAKETPIHHLPVELLQEIFLHAIPPLSTSIAACLSSSVRNGKEPHPHRVRADIVAVCREWKQIAYGTPALWSTIALDKPLPYDLGIIGNLFVKAQDFPCNVYLRYNHLGNYYYWDGWDHMFFTKIPHLLQQKIGQIRSLIVRADRWPRMRRQQLASQLFLPDTRTDVPRLETFVLLVSYEESMRPSDVEIECPVGNLHAPNIRSLVLGAGFGHVLSCMTLDSLQSLESLSIAFPGGVSTSHLERVFLAQNLTFLDVTDGQQDFLDGLMSPRIPRTHTQNQLAKDKVRFPSVTTFHYAGDDSLTFYTILNAFDVPSVENLALKGPFIDEDSLHFGGAMRLEATQAFRWIQDRHLEKVTRLYLGQLHLNGADFSMLPHVVLERLTCLTLFHCSLDSNFFSRFITMSGEFLRIKKIILYGCAFFTEDFEYYLSLTEEKHFIPIEIRFTRRPSKEEADKVTRLQTVGGNERLAIEPVPEVRGFIFAAGKIF